MRVLEDSIDRVGGAIDCLIRKSGCLGFVGASIRWLCKVFDHRRIFILRYCLSTAHDSAIRFTVWVAIEKVPIGGS